VVPVDKLCLYLTINNKIMQKDTVIFDLDGTLALIDARRALSAKPNGKKSAGYKIVIFSGRSNATQDATQNWLVQYGVEYDQLVMRPATDYTPDNDLKQAWLNQHFPGDQKDRILCVYDDRDQVVKNVEG
jgi:FMN phosphatase YigB (HAD superfamily)